MPGPKSPKRKKKGNVGIVLTLFNNNKKGVIPIFRGCGFPYQIDDFVKKLFDAEDLEERDINLGWK